MCDKGLIYFRSSTDIGVPIHTFHGENRALSSDKGPKRTDFWKLHCDVFTQVIRKLVTDNVPQIQLLQ